ncbi:hypothetical protein NPIL_150301 [Nephila pilipes]|uniref:Uncharacterized protein n=1 Tax=Nephila pilipes TaxID=299642 RepID=A0A8X6PZF1_NEPPI|nr:hypothetical protein NPIL_150301 [Nephila pilipes]
MYLIWVCSISSSRIIKGSSIGQIQSRVVVFPPPSWIDLGVSTTGDLEHACCAGSSAVTPQEGINLQDYTELSLSMSRRERSGAYVWENGS